MSSYLQSLTSHLHDKSLLTDDLKAALLEHDDAFNSKPSIRVPFGKHKGMTLREIHAFQPNYIEWLIKKAISKKNLLTYTLRQNSY